jgi:excisionase family DNA binding protein
MRKSSTEKPIKKFCRTFEHLPNDSVPCSVAERIERHRGLLSVHELSPLLGLSPKTVYSWVAAGTLPAVRMGASVKFCPYSTAQWLRAKSG